MSTAAWNAACASGVNPVYWTVIVERLAAAAARNPPGGSGGITRVPLFVGSSTSRQSQTGLFFAVIPAKASCPAVFRARSIAADTRHAAGRRTRMSTPSNRAEQICGGELDLLGSVHCRRAPGNRQVDSRQPPNGIRTGPAAESGTPDAEPIRSRKRLSLLQFVEPGDPRRFRGGDARESFAHEDGVDEGAVFEQHVRGSARGRAGAVELEPHPPPQHQAREPISRL